MLCPKKFVSDTLKIALSSGQRRKPRSCGGAFRGSERAAATPQRASQMVLVVKNPPANAGDIRDRARRRALSEGREAPQAAFPSPVESSVSPARWGPGSGEQQHRGSQGLGSCPHPWAENVKQNIKSLSTDLYLKCFHCAKHFTQLFCYWPGSTQLRARWTWSC